MCRCAIISTVMPLRGEIHHCVPAMPPQRTSPTCAAGSLATGATATAPASPWPRPVLTPVSEGEATLLPQQQRRARGDELGAGEDAKQVLGGERDAPLAVRPAGAGHLHQRAPAQHRVGDAGEQLPVDMAL